MSFQTREVGGATVVEVMGELDVANATDLAEHLNSLFKKFPRKVILDLDGVGYMASSGLAMLVSALRKSREMRVDFGVCGLSPIVRKSVEVTALHEVLPIYHDLNDALKKMN